MEKEADSATQERREEKKIVDLELYRIKKTLNKEGFDIVTNKDGKLTLVLRLKGN